MEKQADIPESKNEMVLAKIRVKMGFSEETLSWFKEIQNTKDTSVTLMKDKAPELIFPDHFKDKIRYDREAESLIFKGVMYNEEKDELLIMSENELYREAIKKLFERSQIWFVKEGGNSFLCEYKDTWKQILTESAQPIINSYFHNLGLTENKLPKIEIIGAHPGSWIMDAIIVADIFFNMYKDRAELIKIAAWIKKLTEWIKKKFIVKTSEEANKLLESEAKKDKLPPPPKEPINADFDVDTSLLLSLTFEVDISELIQLMFVGLSGAYKEIENVLKNFHDKHEKPSHGFLFIESLVHQPLPKKFDVECNDNWEMIKNKTWTFSPLSQRIVRHSLFKTDEDIAKQDILIRLDLSVFTKHIYKRWYDEEYQFNELDFQKPNEIIIDNQEFRNLFYATLNKEITEILKENTGIMAQDGAALKYSKKCLERLKLLLEHLRSLHSGECKTMTCFLVPIASSQIFYGDLFVCVPHFDNDDKLKQLATDLIKCVKDHYVPALAFIHEHFFEDLLTRNKQKTKKGDLSVTYKLKLGEKPDVEMPDYKSPICRSIEKENVQDCYSCTYFGWEESSDNVVEKYLHKLWQDRRTERTDINESLIFKNRLYTDPNMLDRLEDFFKPSKAKLKKDGDLLPSVLVVAPPGAGKDHIPNLLKLFTNCYNRGEIYKLNMASLKPDVITPVAMVGGKFTWEESNDKFHREETSKLKGILREIREKTRKEFEKFNCDRGVEGLIEKSKQYKENLENFIDKIIIGNIQTLQTKLERKVNELGSDINKPINTEKELGEKLNKKREDITNKINELKELATKLLSEIEVKLSKEIRKLEDDLRKKKELEDELSNVKGIGSKLAKIKELEAILSKQKELRAKLIIAKEDAESLYNQLKERGELKDLRPKEKLIVKELFGRFPTIVLDELNSMGLESQGALLRFLENAEITPIGGYKDEMLVNGKVDKEIHSFFTDFLIVGIMNEDPEEITREEAIRFLQRERYIGGLLSDLLYEHILKIRRLRPDLRARMMRNGKFEIPKLEDHRADIPVNFYRFINKEKVDYFQNSKIRINMDTLELLMSPELEWPENFRLLQTLTKKIVEIIYEDYEDKKKELIIIREKHIRKAMKAIGMIKE